MDNDLTKLTAEMLVAYVSNNKVEPGQSLEQIVRAMAKSFLVSLKLLGIEIYLQTNTRSPHR